MVIIGSDALWAQKCYWGLEFNAQKMSMMMAMIVVIMMMMMVVVKGFFLPLPTQVILKNAWINFNPDILKPT